MKVTLEEATEADAPTVFNMQRAAFTPLLDKYQDYSTSPANETQERVIRRINNPESRYFIVMEKGIRAGAINIVQKESCSLWISPLFILPEFQGRGIAQQAIGLAESRYPGNSTWELSTLAEEAGNCHLYEKLSYKRTGESRKLNDRATLIYYRKERLED